MDGAARATKLRELKEELMHERGVAAMGGAPPSPGKIRSLRKNIARILTVLSEEELARARAPPPPPETPLEAPKAKPRAGKGKGHKTAKEKPQEEKE